MPVLYRRRREARLPFAAIFTSLILSGCSSIGDLGHLQLPLVSDDIHAWVGQQAAIRAGAPVVYANLTDDERALRDLAFPLIEPPYDRIRWDAVVYEYGTKRTLQRDLWWVDPGAYCLHLEAAPYRSTAGRYNRLIDDIRNDVVRVSPFFQVARRVANLDQRRLAALNELADVSPGDRLAAQARVGENTLTIAWVQTSLAQRWAGYRYTLEHLAVQEPENLASQADIALAQLQQAIMANQLVQVPQFAAVAVPGAALPPIALAK
jgi:hypothetical protein